MVGDLPKNKRKIVSILRFPVNVVGEIMNSDLPLALKSQRPLLSINLYNLPFPRPKGSSRGQHFHLFWIIFRLWCIFVVKNVIQDFNLFAVKFYSLGFIELLEGVNKLFCNVDPLLLLVFGVFVEILLDDGLLELQLLLDERG